MAIKRDQKLGEVLKSNGIELHSFKDQVVFEESEVVKANGEPYTVFTPFKRKWIEKRKTLIIQTKSLITNNFHKSNFDFPSLFDLGFIKKKIFY